MGKEKNNNKEFSFSIYASGDSYETGDYNNISEKNANKITDAIDDTRGIYEVSDGHYIGENLYVSGKYGSDIITIDSYSIYENTHTEEVYYIGIKIPENKTEILTHIITSYIEENIAEESYYTEDDSIYDDSNRTCYMELSINNWELYVDYQRVETTEEEKVQIKLALGFIPDETM